MSLRNATLFAFIATLLVAVILIIKLVFGVLGVLRGIEPPVSLVTAFIYALASVSATIFFFEFQRRYR